jgi:hypothetical protein
MSMIDWEDRDEEGREALLQYIRTGGVRRARPEWPAIGLSVVFVAVQIALLATLWRG